ncbi:DUF4395 domain-containing protein [Corynebacterium glyciniphilum]|uniref:DUF4395 domain-containing protein n=1 Tax=Corynebacterium glyciniphilum TaxID=1404244 RepID=UPI0011AB8DB4|nr:DUF4395 domain-containing protein [Corynebacterium glyciniphilum]
MGDDAAGTPPDRFSEQIAELGRERPAFVAGKVRPVRSEVPPTGPSTLWWFPPVVNDRAARATAMLVVALTVVTVALSRSGLTVAAMVAGTLLVVGFLSRVLAGPRFDPFGQLSVRWLAQRMFGPPVLVAGAPKRFAQMIGLLFSGTALGLRVAGLTGASDIVLLLLVAAASLEGFMGVCLGCLLFARLQQWGVVPGDIRADCAVRPATPTSAPRSTAT